MKFFWKSMKEFGKKFWKRLWQGLWQMPKQFVQRNTVFLLKELPSEERKEKSHIRKITRSIEAFRFMPKGEQREKFQKTFSSMQDNFIKGGVDNKKCIKHAAHFLKITHTLFLDKKNTYNEYTYNEALVMSAYESSKAQKGINAAFYKFKNELHGIEKSKENNFLDFLNHEESIKIKDSIFNVIRFLYESIKDIDELNSLNTDMFPVPALIKEFEKYESNIKNCKENIEMESRKITEIIVKNLREITDKEKIEKLKKSSEIFRSKAKQYRSIARWLMFGTVAIVGLVVISVYFDFLNDENYQEKFSFVEMNKIVFYVYVILDTLLSGRLLLSVIALTGIFYFLRFFAANQHNAIICDQRANTLESFEALYENAEKPEEKLRVVEKVLNSATEHLPTGFSKQQSDSSGGSGSGSRVGGIELSNLLSLFGRSPPS